MSLSTRTERANIAAGLQKRSFSRPQETLVLALLVLCAGVSLITTVLIVGVLVRESLTFFEEVSVTEFLNPTNEWQPLFEPVSFGIWELVAGTANVTLWALVLAVPTGLATAVYLSEYAHPNTRRLLKPVLEALAGVPTVVYAYFGLTFVTQEILRPVLGGLGFEVPIFNALAASIMLAIMILPTIASVSEDAMANVPRDLREAAYGLGSTRLEVAIRVVIPAALSGIIAAILLAIARVVGETIIVAIIAGSTPNLTLNPLDPVQTMTGFMLQVGLGDANRGTVDYQSLFAVGMMLFLITLLFNVAAYFFVGRYREEYE